MALITKPDMEFIWASGGAIVEPSDVKKQTGWTPEVPPHQWENWVQNRQDQYLAHINQRGIPEWDGNTNYEAGGLSYVQGSDGKIYKSVAASGPSTTTQNPTTDVSDTYWTIAFADVGAFLTQAAGDVRYTQRSNNLSDLPDVTTARTNLSVYSKAETDTRNLNSVRIDVASAGTVNLTTAAPNTRHINITGTTTINDFTAVAGVTYFVRFNAALTLTDGAGLVTQTGANILTAAGDTCIIRATANNVVEVLCPNFTSLNTAPILIVRDQKPSGTAGGTFTSGAWRTRDLNTIPVNTITGASLAANRITLPVGTYDIEGAAVAYLVSDAQAALYNVTDSAFTILGLSNRTGLGSNATGDEYSVRGRFTIAAPKVFEIRHRSSQTGTTNGFGWPNSFGTDEVYAHFEFRKIA